MQQLIAILVCQMPFEQRVFHKASQQHPFDQNPLTFHLARHASQTVDVVP